MYIGSCCRITGDVWLIDDENKASVQTVHITPGAIKLVSELIDNARDNISRGRTTAIDISMADDNAITITNNGESIPVEKHEAYDMYIPGMMASEFRAGDNMETEDRKGRTSAATIKIR